MSRITQIGSILALCLFVLSSAQANWVLAQSEATAGQPDQSGQPLSSDITQPLGPWATMAFVWIILLLAMAFVIAMGWLSRSRR